MKTTKERRCSVKRIFQIVIIAFLSVGAAGIFFAILLAGENGIFGYGARLVMSSSMENDGAEDYEIKEIPAGSLIFIKLLPPDGEKRDNFYASLRTGDVLTFVYPTVNGDVTITHRIQNVERSGAGYIFTLRGDRGAGEQVVDTEKGRIVGKVVFCNHALGVCVLVLSDPLFLIACLLLAALAFPLLSDHKNTLPLEPKPLRREGKMKKKIFVILVALALCAMFITIGATYAMLEESFSTRNHLIAGTLQATLVRQKLTTVNIGDDGNFETVVDDADLNFTAVTNENIFGLTETTVAAPGSSFSAEMNLANNGNVAFRYYVEVTYNSIVSDQDFASMLKITVESEKGERREALLKDGLTLGSGDSGLGEVAAGKSETFTVTLEFLDDKNNNKVENKFVMFDLVIHAVQKTSA